MTRDLTPGGVTLSDADWNHWPDGWSDAQTWEFAAGAGLSGIEVGVYDVATELAPARRDERRRLTDRWQVPVSAVLLSLPSARWPRGALTAPDDELAQLLVQVAGCAQVCAESGLPVLGLWPGADPAADSAAGSPADPATDGRAGNQPRWSAAVEGLARARDAAAVHGVALAVEYKPRTVVATVEDALALADAVPGTGVLLDTGHAWAAGEDPAGSLRRLREAGVLWGLHLGDAELGGSDDDLPLGRRHRVDELVAELRQVPPLQARPVTASFDLYGVVESGSMSGEGAVRESIAAIEAALS